MAKKYRGMLAADQSCTPSGIQAPDGGRASHARTSTGNPRPMLSRGGIKEFKQKVTSHHAAKLRWRLPHGGLQ